MGRRKESVLPEPVCDWMKISREDVSSETVESRFGRAARWMAVGFEIDILVSRWADMRGLRPRPVNVDESSNGALLGNALFLAGAAWSGASTRGFDVKSEDMTCV